MEALLPEQEDTLLLIKKVGINFKKTPKARLTKGYIETRVETLKEYWDKFRITHFEITKLATKTEKKDNVYFREDWFSQGESEYIDIKSDMQDQLEKFKVQITQQISGDTSMAKDKSVGSAVKLPKVNIPQFGGGYNEWNSFRDLFKSLVHENKSLKEIEKLHYLKSSVTGEAEQLLRHLQINENNYETAWSTLNKTYNNRRVIVNCILSRLINQRKLNTGTARGIRDLLDTTLECLNNLKNNDVDIENWDVLIVYLVVNKLDEESHKGWEEELGTLAMEILPTLDRLTQFLETRFRVLETIQPNTSRERNFNKPKSFATTTSIHNKSTNLKCAFCHEQTHAIYACKEFHNLTEEERVDYVQKGFLCFNCLSPSHHVKYCKSKMSCEHCRRRHHSLLHYRNNELTDRKSTTSESHTSDKIATKDSASEEPVIRTHLVTQGQNALMATALINIETGRGLQLVRALIDPCSQESFISERAALKLQLPKKSVNGHVAGVNEMSARINHITEINIASRVNQNFRVSCTAYIVQQVTDVLPAKRVNHEAWTHLRNLTLADPMYYKSATIDILLGVNIYTQILMSGVVKGEPGTPIAQQTHFGWIISGGTNQESDKHGMVSLHLTVTIDNLLQKFWETERLESEEKDTLTPLELRAEHIYEKTVKRDPDGRYVVALPFKRDKPILPEKSREIALKRLNSLEKRLSNNEKLRKEYNEVMREYLTLNHMEPVNENDETKNKRAVYLPHHAVIREDKDTTKVRVVLNASSKGVNGISLNDELLIGPALQEELRDILLRWRMYKVSFIADIIKMYRQILVRKEDIDYQRIVWRFNTDETIKEYRLLTVTFGTACAPYLAIKTLKQTAKDEGDDENYLLARDIVNHDFYVDDCLSGSDDVETAIKAQKQLTKMLRKGGFELQKWCSNSDIFMQNIEPEKRAKHFERDINKKETVKALGITWNIKTDELGVTNKIDILEEKIITKRNVLSVIASLYDPMSWIAPTIVMAKIFMQKLWILGVGWDEELPLEYQNEWKKFRTNIQELINIKIPRWIGTSRDLTRIELHGFADASSKAYAAVVYCRVVESNGEIETSLIKAKTKVAPVKELTLPRLELCAATMLSHVLKRVATAMRIDEINTYAWSDSQVVLAWIHGDPSRWNVYVKNRVNDINNTLNTTWLYVGTKDNPADSASRGVAPEKLKENILWLKGPSFLQERDFKVPIQPVVETEEEMRVSTTCVVTTVEKSEKDEILTLLRRYSSLTKLLSVVAWIRRWRWLHLEKTKEINRHLPKYVTQKEREEALTICLKLSQNIEYAEEIEQLRTEKPIKKTSRLLSLNPFLDDKGVLRVGGRLKNAELEYSSKHPIIISKKSDLLPLLLTEAHVKTLHGGPQMMITYLRHKYWLIDAGNTVKKFVRTCLIGAKQRATVRSQMMGNLPEIRVKPSRPFSISGVDFAGPINVRMSKGRGAKAYKAYIALFICMSTKAIHIELVSDMTTETFMAAYRRFISRRGLCKEMWSDNGTTFVSANKEILEMWKQGKASIPDELSYLLDREGTTWKFIPPGAPNFGGLWEAGVKSVKNHMKRTIGDSTLTFEELNTLLIQIEACLNSRPLSPMSDHPGDLEPLTPAHFLVGEPLVAIPEGDYTATNMTSLSRWKLVQSMTQTFWKRWQREYLSRLQERPKWKKPVKEFEVGDLVLLKDSRCPVSKWILGRIVTKHPGQDNLTRVYEVRTATGIFTRTTTKLCPLPNM